MYCVFQSVVPLNRCDYLGVCDPPSQFISINKTIGQFLFGSQPWAGFIIVWAVQGTVSIPPSSEVLLKLSQ